MNNIYLRHAYPNELYHHGILGQKWGIRRYQNPDGSLTPAGKKRYYKADGTLTRKGRKEYGEQHATLMKQRAAEESKRKADEAFKGTLSGKSINELKSKGFKEDPDVSDSDSVYLTKKVNTANGKVKISAMFRPDHEDPVNENDINMTINALNKHAPACTRQMEQYLNTMLTRPGMEPYKDIGMRLGKIESCYVAKFDNGSRLADVTAPIFDKDHNFRGFLSVEMDPKTGKRSQNVTWDY